MACTFKAEDGYLSAQGTTGKRRRTSNSEYTTLTTATREMVKKLWAPLGKKGLTVIQVAEKLDGDHWWLAEVFEGHEVRGRSRRWQKAHDHEGLKL